MWPRPPFQELVITSINIKSDSARPTDLQLDVVARLATKRDLTGMPSHQFDHTLV